MPNYVENRLIITGKNMKNVFKEIGSKKIPFDFNKIIPYPKHFADADAALAKFRKKNNTPFSTDAPKDGYNNGGYEWCKENWGTKWEADDFSIMNRLGRIEIFFTTAWAPPAKVFNALVEKYPETDFELHYFEQGGAFAGYISSRYYEDEKKSTRDEGSMKYQGFLGG